MVFLLAVLAITVGSFVAFLLASGSWMFYQRMLDPDQLSPAMAGFGEVGQVARTWVSLAVFACVFLVPALFSLTSQAAILGASGRERRLATLRLIGLSSREISWMTALETGLQAAVGIVLGLLLSVLSLPLFENLKFQDTPIRTTELVLPWWGYVGVAVFLLLLAIVSSLLGMQRVRVSPLGVTRREVPKALRWWRPVAFVLIVAAGIYFTSQTKLSVSNAAVVVRVGLVIFIMISALNLVMPWLLQLVASLMSHLPGTANYVACRRIATDGRAAWKRSGTITFFGLIAGFLVVAPFGEDGLASMLEAQKEAGIIFGDLARGGLLTLLFGFLIFSVAVLLNQASEVFEKADLSRSLARLGVQSSFHLRVALVEYMGPVILVSTLGLVFGAALGLATLSQAGDIDVAGRVGGSFVLLSAGWLVSLLAIVCVAPLRNSVIGDAVRKND